MSRKSTTTDEQPSEQSQGKVKASSRDEIIRVGTPRAPLEPLESLKNRIIDVVSAGVRGHGEDRGVWAYEPGALPYWEARQRVGGRQPAATFAAAVESLLRDGRLVEVRFAAIGRRNLGHRLVIPGRFAGFGREVAEARGRADVLEREPWAPESSG